MNISIRLFKYCIKDITALSILGLICLFTVQNVTAQPDRSIKREQFIANKQQLQSAVDSRNNAGIGKARSSFQSFTESNDKQLQKLAYYYLGYANYRLGTQFKNSKGEQTEKYLNSAIEYLKETVQTDPDFAEGWVLLASVFGLKSDGMFSAMKYGPKSNKAMEKALQKAPENPRVHMLNAIGLLYKPRMFGGSTEKAIKEFKKAAALYSSYHPKNKLMPDWGHAEAYAWLGRAYEKKEEYRKAKSAYKKALEINPHYRWVKDELMPALAKKLN